MVPNEVLEGAPIGKSLCGLIFMLDGGNVESRNNILVVTGSG